MEEKATCNSRTLCFLAWCSVRVISWVSLVFHLLLFCLLVLPLECSWASTLYSPKDCYPLIVLCKFSFAALVIYYMVNAKIND